jgi:hypothetical protein
MSLGDPQVGGSSPVRATDTEPNRSLTFGLLTSGPKQYSRSQRFGGECGACGLPRGVRPRQSRTRRPAYASVEFEH